MYTVVYWSVADLV